MIYRIAEQGLSAVVTGCSTGIGAASMRAMAHALTARRSQTRYHIGMAAKL